MPSRDAALCAMLAERWVAYFQVVAQSYTIPSRVDTDDCVQECCVELSMLVNEMDPADPDFDAILKTRIFRRLIDLHRHEHYAKRNVAQTVALEDETDFPDKADPSSIVAVRDLEIVIEGQLTSQQMLVWRELTRPGRGLRQCILDYRRSRGLACHNVPVSVYAEVTGLSYRQVRHALIRIKDVTRSVLAKEGMSYAGTEP